MHLAVKDFFISYTGADVAWAKWIDEEVRRAGFSTIIQASDFLPGENFVLNMHEALQQAERVMPVYSPAYFKSRFGPEEWMAKFAEKPDALLPVRIEDCQPPGLLRPIVYIDLVKLDEGAARTALRRGLGTATAFPGPKQERFPGSLPPIWSLLKNRNADFTGRAQLLEELHDSLKSGAVTAVTALAGLGGIGKTELANEYCYRYASEYDIVWWLRAEQSATAAEDLARLGEKLPIKIEDPAKAVAEVLDWIAHNSGWLLVFDNAEDAASCDAFRPRGNTGRILITSRNPNFLGANRLPVERLDPQDAIAFLVKRTGRSEDAAELAQDLDFLPLALEYAAAYVVECAISIADYRKLLATRAGELLEPVAQTFEVSLQRLQKENPRALELLNLIAFLAPDDIPRDLLETDAMDLNQRIKGLRRYSLIQAKDGMISIHRLLQRIVREKLSREEQDRYAEQAVDLVESAFPNPADHTNWPQCAKLLPHVVSTTGFAENRQVGFYATARLLNDAGYYQWRLARLPDALALFERSLHLAEKLHGPDSALVAIRANNIGQVLRMQGDLNGALQHAQRALAIDEKVYGPEHPEVAIDANNVGTILQAQGDLQGALRHTQRALAIDEKVYGPEHPQVAIRANNIGRILQDQGDLDGALQYAQRALSIDEKLYGPDHPEVATDIACLGTILLDLGKLDNALPLLERAFRVYTSIFGPDHPDTKTAANNLRNLQQKIAARDAAQ
jgi:tetratricopeptide (TPR) repeat protein